MGTVYTVSDNGELTIVTSGTNPAITFGGWGEGNGTIKGLRWIKGDGSTLEMSGDEVVSILPYAEAYFGVRLEGGAINGIVVAEDRVIIRATEESVYIQAESLDLNNKKITNVASPSSSTDVATKEYVDSVAQGLDWQESVKTEQNTPPPTPSLGDRYIVGTSPTDEWTGHAKEIAEWNGTEWVFTTPNDGFACWLENDDILKVYNGTSWVQFGSTIDHGVLQGLGDDDHTQYLPVSGARAMAGTLDIGGYDIASVKNIYGYEDFDFTIHAQGDSDLILTAEGSATLRISDDGHFYFTNSVKNILDIDFNSDCLIIYGTIKSRTNTDLLLRTPDNNKNIILVPHGTGKVVIGETSDGNISSASGQSLILSTPDSNKDIKLNPHGTGKVVIGGTEPTIDFGSVSGYVKSLNSIYFYSYGSSNPVFEVGEAEINCIETVNCMKSIIMSNVAGTFLKIPAMSTANRPSMPSSGTIIFNSTTNQFEGYNGSSWVILG